MEELFSEKFCQDSRFLWQQTFLWQFGFSMFSVPTVLRFFFSYEFQIWQSTLRLLLCTFILCYFIMVLCSYIGSFPQTRLLSIADNQSTINNRYNFTHLCRRVLLENTCFLPDTLFMWIYQFSFPQIPNFLQLSSFFIIFLLLSKLSPIHLKKIQNTAKLECLGGLVC